jgi:membrane dipeptidase
MKEGGLDAVFFSIYVAADYVGKQASEGGGPARRALDMIDSVYEQVRRHPESLEMAYTVADVRRAARRGRVAALMGIEGGHAIENSLGALRQFHRLGVRYMTLTHSNTNDWADSEGDLRRKGVKHHGGLTDFGREVVREMNRLGMMVDISHVADDTFFDVIEVTQAPVIASHSSCRALAPHTRNMTDDQLRALAKNGGVVMINFYDAFIDPKKAEVGMRRREKRDELREKYPDDRERVTKELEEWDKEHDVPGRTPMSVLVDHIDHAVKVAGVDHVGIGADYDGIPLDGAPEGLDDVAKLPSLTYELLRRGYSDRDVRKVLGENLLRVMLECERVAARAR